MKKQIKFIMVLIFGLLAFSLILNLSSFSTLKDKTSAYDNLIYPPQAVAISDNSILVYDQTNNRIKEFNKITKEQTHEESVSGLILDMIIIGNEYLLLLKPQTSPVIIEVYSLSDWQKSNFSESLTATYLRNKGAKSLNYSDGRLYVLLSRRIEIFNITLPSFTVEHSHNAIPEYFGDTFEDTDTFIDFSVVSINETYIATEDALFKANLASGAFSASIVNSFTDGTPISCSAISYSSYSYILVSFGLKTNFMKIGITTTGPHTLLNTSERLVSDIYAHGTEIYLSETKSISILMYNVSDLVNSPYTPTVVLTNNFTDPASSELNDSENILIVEIKQSCSLLAKPYDENSTITTLTEQAKLIVLTEDDSKFNGFYYCMLPGTDTNSIGYVLKNKCEEISTATTNQTKRVFGETATIFKYPSVSRDTINTRVCSLNLNDRVTVTKTLGTYKTVQGASFVMVQTETDGTTVTGYVLSNALIDVSVTPSPRVLTNATIIHSSKVYLVENMSDSYVLTISKGTRIKISERLNNSNMYTKVIFNLSSGEEIEGYVLTKNIKPDGLTTLQIVGIVLVFLNTLLLVIIYFTRNKIMKQKNIT